MPTTTGFATDLITFSRGSLATVTDSNGYIKWAPHNLLLASEQFDASYWTKTGSTLAANNVVSPNGTTTADTLTASAGSSTHCLFSAGVTIQTATNYTYAAFLKKGTHNYATIIALSGPTSWVAITVDFSGSSPVISQTGAGAGGTYVTSGIEAVSNGFYRVWFTASLTVAPVQMEIALSSTATPTYGSYGEVSWSAAGTETIALWGAHLYRSDLGGMQANASAYPYYNPSTPKNLLGFSEAFDNAAWAKSALLAFGSGSVVNAIAAPNGSLSADLIVPDTTSAAHLLFQSSTVGGLNVQSAYVKPAGYTKVGMRESQTGAYFASFDLVGSGSVLTASSATASITALNDGWYRIAIIGTISGTTRWSLYILDPSYTSGGVTGSWTANGTSGIYLWGAQLSDSASLDPYVGSYGAAPSPAAAYGPRLDYDPSTLAAKGLLVEETRQNLLLQSNNFSTSWNNTNITATPSSAVSPDGTMNAVKIEATATSTTTCAQIVSSAGSASGNTFSVYVKQGTGATTGNTFAVYNTTTATTLLVVTLNYSTGAISYSTGSSGASATNVGNGWWRVVLTPPSGISAGNTLIGYVGFVSTSATAGHFLYAYGAQLEAGAFATSYIPTAAATVTRNADVASVATSQFAYSATEGTLVMNVTALGAPGGIAYPGLAMLSTDASNKLGFYSDPSGSPITFAVVNGGASQASINSSVSAVNNIVKIAGAYKANDFAVSANGGTVQTDTSGSVPSATTMSIGTFDNIWNGHIRQITYIPRRLTNAELISRTA